MLVAASPTFEWFTKFPPRSGTEIVTVPLTKEYEHDLDAMLARTGPGPTLVYVCNPNNPTGTLTNPKHLEAFVRALPATTRVVIDEAYHDYVSPSAGYSSWLDRSEVDPRVIVTRSFSKIHGLAALRIGYAVAAPETLRLLRLDQLEDGVSVVSAMAARIALDDADHVRTSLARNEDDAAGVLQRSKRADGSSDRLQDEFRHGEQRPSRGANCRALPKTQRLYCRCHLPASSTISACP